MKFSQIITTEDQEEISHAVTGINLSLLMLAAVARTLPDFLDARMGVLPDGKGC